MALEQYRPKPSPDVMEENDPYNGGDGSNVDPGAVDDRPDSRHRGGDRPQQQQRWHGTTNNRRSRPIAIPRKASIGSTEDLSDDEDDDEYDNDKRRADGHQQHECVMAASMPAMLRAPLLGSSLPHQHRQPPPPLVLSDAAASSSTTFLPSVSAAAFEMTVPYGSLRDHQHRFLASASVPNPHMLHHHRSTTAAPLMNATTMTTGTTGLSIADRIRQSTTKRTNIVSSSPSSLTYSDYSSSHQPQHLASHQQQLQISSLSRMMSESVKISTDTTTTTTASSSSPKSRHRSHLDHDVILSGSSTPDANAAATYNFSRDGDPHHQQQQQQQQEYTVSVGSLTGLQLLQEGRWPQLSSSTTVPSSSSQQQRSSSAVPSSSSSSLQHRGPAAMIVEPAARGAGGENEEEEDDIGGGAFALDLE
jgi:hypothetical protein